jgi:phage baseplate assembly protein W
MIMAVYKDFTLNKSEYNKAEEIEDSTAITMAVKNILLSKPGNYPLTPDFGMDIGKYQFDLLDDQTISNIKTELSRQISKYIPSLENVFIDVEKVDSSITGVAGGIGISISSSMNGTKTTDNYLVYSKDSNVYVVNETY